MFPMIFIVLIAATTIGVSTGCLSRPYPNDSSQEGSFQVEEDLTAQVERTSQLRQFFTNCLFEKTGMTWTWESVVDFTILDTQWFLNSELISCRTEYNVDCWKNRLRTFLKTTSDLLQPSRECIDEYAVSNRAGARFRAKRQTSSNVNERSGFFPNSPQFRFYTACYDNEINLPTGRADVDFLTVAQFVNEDVACNPEFLGCDANNEDVTLPEWLYRMQTVTREGSPVRDALAICNNRPTPPPQDSYGERRQTSFVECTTKTLTLLRSNAIFSSIGDIIVTPGFLRDAWVLCSYAKPQQPLSYCINRLFTLLVIDDPIIVDPTVIPFPTLLPPLPTAPLPSLILRFAPKEFAVLFCSVL